MHGFVLKPFAGTILADFEAVVTRTDRLKTLHALCIDQLARFLSTLVQNSLQR